MEALISEWHGPSMQIERYAGILGNAMGGDPGDSAPLFVLRMERPRYVARHPELPKLSAYGDHKAALEEFISDILRVARSEKNLSFGRRNPTGAFFIDEDERFKYEQHRITQFLYEEVN